MKTYKDLKSVSYIEPAIHFAETLLDVQFNRTGKNRYSAFCPFHADTKDSFRVYSDGKDEVKFHCFGDCKGNWDIYDLVMLRDKCSFREAQIKWADYLDIKGFKPFDGKSNSVPEPDEEPEPEDSVGFIEPELDHEIIAALDESARFYNELLLSDEDRFKKIYEYLHRRGVETDLIRRFNIGYAPPYSDEQYQGRALIDQFLPLFDKDYKVFQPFTKASLVRLLNDENVKGYGYYRQQIDFSRRNAFSSGYGDYFAGRIVFPILNIDAQAVGFTGRRPDNRGVRWLKQKTGETAITTKGWLYGIDKAHRYIKQYRTVILVEGIFDYFAFYKLLQDQEKPIVVSTLGSYLTDEARDILKGLGIEHFIVAYDWDNAGKKGIWEIASEVGGKVFYLGGMKEGQDPYDKLKPVISVISGFSLQHLLAGAKKAQGKTDKPVNIHIMTSGKPEHRNVVFETTGVEAAPFLNKDAEPSEYYYSTDDFLPLLTYNHGNKPMLDKTIEQIIKLLEARPTKPQSPSTFTIPVKFLQNEGYADLGAALILWLRLAIEQQKRKRKIKETDETLAGWLNTSRATISNYKRRLKELGFINIDTDVRPQRLSVRYFPRQQH